MKLEALIFCLSYFILHQTILFTRAQVFLMALQNSVRLSSASLYLTTNAF